MRLVGPARADRAAATTTGLVATADGAGRPGVRPACRRRSARGAGPAGWATEGIFGRRRAAVDAGVAHRRSTPTTTRTSTRRLLRPARVAGHWLGERRAPRRRRRAMLAATSRTSAATAGRRGSCSTTLDALLADDLRRLRGQGARRASRQVGAAQRQAADLAHDAASPAACCRVLAVPPPRRRPSVEPLPRCRAARAARPTGTPCAFLEHGARRRRRPRARRQRPRPGPASTTPAAARATSRPLDRRRARRPTRSFQARAAGSGGTVQPGRSAARRARAAARTTRASCHGVGWASGRRGGLATMGNAPPPE